MLNTGMNEWEAPLGAAAGHSLMLAQARAPAHPHPWELTQRHHSHFFSSTLITSSQISLALRLVALLYLPRQEPGLQIMVNRPRECTSGLTKM